MSKVDVAGLQLDAITKKELLNELLIRLSRGEQTFVTTPYSEFLYAAVRNKEVMAMFNKADLAVPDGIGVLWAQRYLSIPFTVKNYYSKILQALWQMVYSGAGILLHPQTVYRVFPEKLTGANLVWDLAKLASDNGWSMYLLGGQGKIPEIASYALRRKYPQLKIAGTSNKHYQDPTIITDIQAAKPDMVLVAFGPVRQEQWIVDHRGQLPAKLFIGLGGTFDYLAGNKMNPPKFIRDIGLEWLHRLVTQPQPRRIRRVMQGTLGLIVSLVRYKFFQSFPYRPNVVSVIFNEQGQILAVRRNPQDKVLPEIGEKYKEKFRNYWQFPQGGREVNEDLEKAARREVQEETAIESLQLIKVSAHVNRYFYPNALRKLLGNGTPFKGQEQNVLYFRFTGSDSEIKPDNDELIDYKWVTVTELKDTLHKERHELVDILLKDSSDLKSLE